MIALAAADRRTPMLVLGGGVTLGLCYTLSPLTVLCIAALAGVTWRVSKDLEGRERRWFLTLLSVAILARLVAIGALFLFADPSKPFDTFFGDEEIFKSRTIWLRNVGLGIPISAADFIYAFDETGMSGHLYVLAFLQALVGDAPYGVHVFNATVYITATLLLHSLARAAYGRLAAMGGLVVLLLLPSLFAWSISALKEPVYMMAAVAELMCVLAVVRAPRAWQRVASVGAILILAMAMENLRNGTLLVASIGAVVGLAAGMTIARPRLFLAASLVLPLALVAVLTRPVVQERLLTVGRDSVRYHVGHVITPGFSYKIVDPRYYYDWPAIQHIGGREASAFALRAVVSYFMEPLPRNTDSKALWAYLPEHVLWLVMIALVPIGLLAGLKRDALLTCVLVAHACAVIMMVALTSGNIGTLIRHRGLSLPYLVWLSALGGLTLIRSIATRPAAGEGGTDSYGNR